MLDDIIIKIIIMIKFICLALIKTNITKCFTTNRNEDTQKCKNKNQDKMKQ